MGYPCSAATCWLQHWTHWMHLRMESKTDEELAEEKEVGHAAEPFFMFDPF